jgi:hypothetical protein
MIEILVYNQTTVLTDAQVQAVIPALQTQLDRDLCPAWQLGQHKLVFVPKTQAALKGQWQFLFLDNTSDASALGYHDQTANGDPVAYIGVQATIDDSGTWSVTASHELCEMCVNPNLNDSEYNDKQNRVDIREVCDAVESDSLGYEIDGVLVSDFVLPGWFNADVTPVAPLSFGGHVTQPFELAPGGYISFLDLTKPSAGWQQVFADASKQKRPGTSRGEIRARVAARSGMARKSTV